LKKWNLLFIVLLGSCCFFNNAFASSFQKFVDRPIELIPGKITGCFLWQDTEGVHLRMTTDGSVHSFSGTISTDGKFEDVFGKYGDDGDTCIQVNDKYTEITYEITTSGDERAIDFHIRNGKKVTFKLMMDDNDINPQYIIIGKEGWHPTGNEVILKYKKNNEDNMQNVVSLERQSWGTNRYPDNRYWHGPRW